MGSRRGIERRDWYMPGKEEFVKKVWGQGWGKKEGTAQVGKQVPHPGR